MPVSAEDKSCQAAPAATPPGCDAIEHAIAVNRKLAEAETSLARLIELASAADESCPEVTSS